MPHPSPLGLPSRFPLLPYALSGLCSTTPSQPSAKVTQTYVSVAGWRRHQLSLDTPLFQEPSSIYSLETHTRMGILCCRCRRYCNFYRNRKGEMTVVTIINPPLHNIRYLSTCTSNPFSFLGTISPKPKIIVCVFTITKPLSPPQSIKP